MPLFGGSACPITVLSDPQRARPPAFLPRWLSHPTQPPIAPRDDENQQACTSLCEQLPRLRERRIELLA